MTAGIFNGMRRMRGARRLPLLLSTIALITACRRDSSSSANAALAIDTALAGDLRKAADTTAYGESGDVATTDLPDSGLVPMRVSKSSGSRVPPPPIPGDEPPATPPAREPAPAPAPAPAREPAPAPVRAPARAPAPATREVAGGDVTASSAAIGSQPTSPCESPATADQRRCLMTYLARSDAGLDRTYQSLIAEMKRQAEPAPGEREPDAVLRLREAQRAWLVYRDTECRRRNRGREGPLWAPARAECLGEFSGRRADELATSLARLQGR